MATAGIAGRAGPREQWPAVLGRRCSWRRRRSAARGEASPDRPVEDAERDAPRRVWSASSPETTARSASDETISSGAKRRAASVDLPGAGRADEHDEARIGEDEGRHRGLRSPGDLRHGAQRGGPRSRRPRPRGPRSSAGRRPSARVGRGRRSAGSASRATGTRCSRRRPCPRSAARRRGRTPRAARGSVSPIRTTTRSLIPARIFVGVASGSGARSSTSPVSRRIHFVPAPRNAWRLTMLPST